MFRSAAVVLVFLAMVSSAHADSLTVGETIGFKGVFCKNVEAADRVFVAKTSITMVEQYNREPFCAITAAPVEIMGVVKEYQIGEQTYTLVKVKAPDGSFHFIATTMPVHKGIPA